MATIVVVGAVDVVFAVENTMSGALVCCTDSTALHSSLQDHNTIPVSSPLHQEFAGAYC